MSEQPIFNIRPKMSILIPNKCVIDFKDKLPNDYNFFTRDKPLDLSSNMVLSMNI